MRKTKSTPVNRVFLPPSQMSWTDEKLAPLSKEQLLNLLDNLQTQRESGRITAQAADEVTGLIAARLPAGAMRRWQKAFDAQQRVEAAAE